MSHQTQPLSVGSKAALEYNIDKIIPLLDAPEGSFHVDEITGKNKELAQHLKIAKHKGAIDMVGTTWLQERTSDCDRMRHVNLWKWNEEIRTELQEYVNQMDTLPCGHRVHIYNPREVDELSCRFCAENNEYPEYSKELVNTLL